MNLKWRIAIIVGLVAASIWMILAARGVGGIFGKTMNLIVIGAIILGVAHLLATGVWTHDHPLQARARPAGRHAPRPYCR